jgi:hypothetical protein
MKALYAVKATSTPVPSGGSSENASCPFRFRDASDAPTRSISDGFGRRGSGGAALQRLGNGLRAAEVQSV